MKAPSSPIKRNAALVSFSKDHHFALLLVWKIRQGLAKGIPANRIASYATDFFRKHLIPHFRDEEEMLFTKLQAGDALRVKAELQHQGLYKLANDIEKTIDDSGGLLTRFADELESHIRFEERVLFNHLQASISALEMEQIARRMESDAIRFDDECTDKFWE